MTDGDGKPGLQREYRGMYNAKSERQQNGYIARMIGETMEERPCPTGGRRPVTHHDEQIIIRGRLEANTVAGVTSARLTWPCDFNDVAPLEAVVARDWVGQLDARKLGLLQPALR